LRREKCEIKTSKAFSSIQEEDLILTKIESEKGLNFQTSKRATGLIAVFHEGMKVAT
jgi:hypothetical protein